MHIAANEMKTDNKKQNFTCEYKEKADDWQRERGG